MNIFIGNLSYNVTEGDLRQAFEAFGQVASATVAYIAYGMTEVYIIPPIPPPIP